MGGGGVFGVRRKIRIYHREHRDGTEFTEKKDLAQRGLRRGREENPGRRHKAAPTRCRPRLVSLSWAT
jgi:hypothetical protein